MRVVISHRHRTKSLTIFRKLRRMAMRTQITRNVKWTLSHIEYQSIYNDMYILMN